jgi:hypothetical protein
MELKYDRIDQRFSIHNLDYEMASIIVNLLKDKSKKVSNTIVDCKLLIKKTDDMSVIKITQNQIKYLEKLKSSIVSNLDSMKILMDKSINMTSYR